MAVAVVCGQSFTIEMRRGKELCLCDLVTLDKVAATKVQANTDVCAAS